MRRGWKRPARGMRIGKYVAIYSDGMVALTNYVGMGTWYRDGRGPEDRRVETPAWVHRIPHPPSIEVQS